jgi:hypothetical protein
MRSLLEFTAIIAALVALASPARQSEANELVHISSQVVYHVRPDLGPVRVAWDVTLLNNDPATANGESETVFFYENLTVPILRGASAPSATSSEGAALPVTLTEPGRGPTVSGVVSFERPIFYGESYSFRLEYELPALREQSLIVSPTYVYLPAIAGGDESTVTVEGPSSGGWSVSVEPGECQGQGSTFHCSGEDASFLAALVEVSRPDAITTLPFQVQMDERRVEVALNYFLGEEAVADHLQQLITAALPEIETLMGFPYPASAEITISQGGRQAVLGYEGLTTCNPGGGCRVVVSPAVDDVTVLHELVHLWTAVYERRWLSEGFAQLIAEEAAATLPQGLVQTHPPGRELASVQLPLDQWGEVSSLLGAGQSEIDSENAGYDRSLQFLQVLRAEVGSTVLREVNATIAGEGIPADSRRFLDLVEDKSGKQVDALFGEWVFPPSFEATLASRREARSRLASLTELALAEDLPEELLNTIREEIAAWEFDEALAALTEAETRLGEFKEIREDLSLLVRDTEAAGLSLPASITGALSRWAFSDARQLFAEARQALDAYNSARERVGAPRNVLESFGLIGSDPNDDLERAADAFATGEFRIAEDRSNHAAQTVHDASESAAVRLTAIAIVLTTLIAGAGLFLWVSQRQEREFAGY